MRLCVYENGVEGQSHKFLVGDANIQMAGVLLHIYKAGSPSGTMRLELYSATDVSNRIAYADVLLSALPSGYFHGFIKFDLQYSLAANTAYYLVLGSAGGYAYGASNFFGLVISDALTWKGKWGMDFRILKYRNLNRGR